MQKAFSPNIFRQCRIMRASALVIGLSVISFPAAAEVYPVSGVWTAINPDFPAAANETCITLKAIGIDAVSKKSISEIIIFAGQKRFGVKGDDQTQATIKSIKVADGRFRITETLSRRARWFRPKPKATYFLTVTGPQTIEIRDARGVTRYRKCGPERPSA